MIAKWFSLLDLDDFWSEMIHIKHREFMQMQ